MVQIKVVDIFSGNHIYFAVPVLKSIHQTNHIILEVYTQEPKKKNRGQKISLSPVHEYANQINIQVRHPVSLNTEEELQHIKKIKPDIVVVVAFGKIFSRVFFNNKTGVLVPQPAP